MKLSSSLLGKHFKLLVVGGGGGGLGASYKFAKVLPPNSIGIIEPSKTHYYQPGFTLVGGGLMSLEANTRQEKDLFHPNTVWINKAASKFLPEKNQVILNDGEELTYDFMILATGVVPRFDKIKGLEEALNTPGVCTNYSPKYVQKTFEEIKKYESGNIIFTFPNAPIKCPGAPQKICYITDSQLRKVGKRENGDIYYMTALPKIFGVEKYQVALDKVAAEKKIVVKTLTNLIEINSKEKLATFEVLNKECKPSGETIQMKYSMIHVGPPCSPIAPLIGCQPLTDANGYIDVNPTTLQSKTFKNVFGVGDCMNTPNPKTAAAVSSHLKTVEKNLKAVMKGETPEAAYDGYASCPLVVDTNKVILAEFSNGIPMETLPIDQSKPSIMSYAMKRYLMPFLYWHGLIKGVWNGPSTIRKILHLGFLPKQK